MIRPCLFALVVAVAVFAGVSHAQPKTKAPPADPRPKELTGLVVRVIDGDTFWLRVTEGQPHEVVRLQNIDAPESCQPGGKDSTQALSRLVLNKTVNVKIAARDDYSRLVATAFEGTTDVGEQLVRDGHAWSQRDQYGRGPLMVYQRMAQTLKRGVHAAGDAVEPREFRRVNGPCEGAKPAATAASGASAMAKAPTAVRRTTSDVKDTNRRCDGRTYCSQMRSCEEATWFLKNCPGMKMDGNNDGRPCEQSLCR